MKSKLGLGGMTSGIIRPRSGEGRYICCKCGERFSRYLDEMNLFDLIGLPIIRCPKCGSFRIKRDPMIVLH